jgi:hypothetical protein
MPRQSVVTLQGNDEIVSKTLVAIRVGWPCAGDFNEYFASGIRVRE